MAKVNAQQWLQKWGQNLNAAGPAITAGIGRVQTAPAQKAIAAKALMLANLTAAINSGVWENQLSKVSLQDWRDAITTKGIPRIAQGVSSAQAKKVQQITNVLAAVDASVAAIESTPRGTLEQNIARMTGFVRAMHQNAPKRQGAK